MESILLKEYFWKQINGAHLNSKSFISNLMM